MNIILNENKTRDGTLTLGPPDEQSTDDYGELLQGEEGRKYILSPLNSSVNPVVRVYGFIPEPKKSVLIENLIIDGGGLGVTGILLENVPHCLIRNVTIRNCEVGVHIRDRIGLWSECNVLKHIRMENVKKGIVFTTTGPHEHPNDPTKTLPGASAAFTSIEDVDIGLADFSDSVGIQVGGTQLVNPFFNDPVDSYITTIQTEFGVPIPNTNPQKYTTVIMPYSSHIRARVRLGHNNGGTGLRVMNGYLHYAQAHLTVTKTGSSGGIGIDIQNHPVTNAKQDRVIWHNQFSTFGRDTSNNEIVTKGGFMLVVGSNIATPISPTLYNASSNPNGIHADIQIKTLPP